MCRVVGVRGRLDFGNRFNLENFFVIYVKRKKIVKCIYEYWFWLFILYIKFYLKIIFINDFCDYEK